MAQTCQIYTLQDEGYCTPHLVFDKSKRDDGTFSRSAFQFDEPEIVDICPAGKQLTTRGTVVNDDQVLYRA